MEPTAKAELQTRSKTQAPAPRPGKSWRSVQIERSRHSRRRTPGDTGNGRGRVPVAARRSEPSHAGSAGGTGFCAGPRATSYAFRGRAAAMRHAARRRADSARNSWPRPCPDRGARIDAWRCGGARNRRARGLRRGLGVREGSPPAASSGRRPGPPAALRAPRPARPSAFCAPVPRRPYTGSVTFPRNSGTPSARSAASIRSRSPACMPWTIAFE